MGKDGDDDRGKDTRERIRFVPPEEWIITDKVPTAFLPPRVTHPEDDVTDARVLVHRTAVVDAATTRLAQGVKIGPFSRLENAEIGEFTVLGNAIFIGGDGFGYTPVDRGEPIRKEQLRRVSVGARCVFRSGITVDRGSWRDTSIGDACKIDSQVHIGHNAVIGANAILCGKSGVAGSATLGNNVVLGGASLVRDHVTVGDGARIGGGSGVIADVPAGAVYMGYPAVPLEEWKAREKLLRTFGRIAAKGSRLLSKWLRR